MTVLTPHQQAVLDLLTENEYLTTRQIWEYLPLPGRDRAKRYLLARLEHRGWLRSDPLYPERGAASERYWTLTQAGAQELGLQYQAPQMTQLADIRTVLEAGASGPVGVGANQARVLHLLAEWKQLTTSQIWQYLDPDKPRWATQQILRILQGKQMVRGVDLYPTQGTKSEHYWMLLERGARAIGVAYHQQYRRRPTTLALRYRGVQLQLISVVEEAGWKLLPPLPTESRSSLQERLLVEAVLAEEKHAISILIAQGHDRQSLQARINHQEQGVVGAIVPDQIPDYVVYVPGQPRRTVVLIPHPPYATRSFWSHKRAPGAADRATVRPGRTELYARLAPILPVLALFETEDEAQHYAPLLKRAGFHVQLVADLGTWLKDHTLTMPHPPQANAY